MNKQELLALAQNKFTSLLQLEKVEQVENVTWYLAHYFDTDGDQGTKGHIGFYVVDENEPGETAYWSRSEPKPSAPPTPPPTFQHLLQEYLTSLIEAGTIEGGTIQALDTVNDTATVAVWLASGENIVLKQFFIDKDPEGPWRRREIVS